MALHILQFSSAVQAMLTLIFVQVYATNIINYKYSHYKTATKAHIFRHIDIRWQTEIKGDGTSYSSVLICCSGDAVINLCSSLCHQYNRIQILPLQDSNKSTHFSSYRHRMADWDQRRRHFIFFSSHPLFRRCCHNSPHHQSLLISICHILCCIARSAKSPDSILLGF